MSRVLIPAAAALLMVGCQKAPSTAPAPHQIHIAGSSAAYPFSTAAAERLMREEPSLVAPLVRADGSGSGIARFCDKPSLLRPDIVITSRAMSPAETRRCAENGTRDFLSVPIGRTAFVIVIAKGSALQGLSRAALFRALTEPNARTWADIDPALPARSIRIEGPAPDPLIADGLLDLLLAPGCAAAGGQDCTSIQLRRDGVYGAHGADAALIGRAVATTPGAIGILPYAQAWRQRDTLDMLPLDGTTPSSATVVDGRYAASAPLLLLVRSGDIATVPGLARLLGFYADSLKPDGTFATNGLIPLQDAAQMDATSRLTKTKGVEK